MAQRQIAPQVFPSAQQPVLEQNADIFTMPWRQFLETLWRRVGSGGYAAITSPTVGASPWTYTATVPGTLYVSGGTVSNVSIVRLGTAVSIEHFAVLLSQGDEVVVTYSAAPAVSFVPL